MILRNSFSIKLPTLKVNSSPVVGCSNHPVSKWSYRVEHHQHITLIPIGISLIKQRNNRGARTVPCGTSDDTESL